MGGADDSHVDVDRFRPAHPLDLLVLKDSQKSRLSQKRQIADLIEEDRPPLGPLEATPFPGYGTGEGPFFMAEKLTVDEAFRYRPAVDLYERAVFAGRRVVDGVGDHLLAGAGFSEQQNRTVQLGHLPDASHHLLQPHVRADNLIAGTGAELAVQKPVVVGQHVFQPA